MARYVEDVPQRLEPGCPDSGFRSTGLYAGHHCGCNACCFCGRAHPVPLTTKRGARRKEAA